MAAPRKDRRRNITPEGREYIDSLSDILEGTSGDGPATPLMELVGEFQVIPTVRCRNDINKWLTQMQAYINSYKCFMDERLGIKS